MTIAKIIQEIAATSSTNAKLAILKANAKNTSLQMAFAKAYNPRLNYYIKSPTQMPPASAGTITENLLSEFDKLSKRVVTGNSARDHFNDMLSRVDADSQKVLCDILDRDLRCGAGTSLANKVWNKIIPEFPIMLCSKMDAKAQKHLSEAKAYIVQKKSDGGRINVIVDSAGGVEYYSRNGSKLELFGTFDSMFGHFPNTVFDGELLVKTADGVADRKTSNGNFTRAARGTLTKQQADDFIIDLWDCISLHEFHAGKGALPYTTRFDYLSTSVRHIINSPRVSVVESLYTTSLDKCLEFYVKMREQGEEGAVIKIADSVWEDGRSKNLIKLKAEETADLICVGVENGLGKYANMIGNLICETSCGKLRVGVGIGLEDKDRSLPIGSYLGKVIEVKYNEVITSKTKSTSSLFLPVFIQIRYDKQTANSLEELK